MVPVASSSPSRHMPAVPDVPLAEIVFSCSICQATVSEVYATHESNQGFHSGSGDDAGLVAKMWITECSHVTCASHLSNGAVPFHPKDTAPRVPCPRCVQEKGDASLKDMFSIRGLGDGEHDAIIPSEWRNCPPIRLSDGTPGMSAVSFQYAALSRFAVQARQHWKLAVHQRSENEAAWDKERKQRRKLQQELQAYERGAEALREREAACKKWEDRKPLIQHYLDVLPKMQRDVESMRNQLLHFGVTVTTSDYTYRDQPEAVGREPALSSQGHHDHDHLARAQQKESSSGYKRKRETHEHLGAQKPRTERHGISSRDLMPPPLPISRFPINGGGDGTMLSRPAAGNLRSSQQRIQTDDHEYHRSGDLESPRRSNTPGTLRSDRGQFTSNLPYRPLTLASHHFRVREDAHQPSTPNGFVQAGYQALEPTAHGTYLPHQPSPHLLRPQNSQSEPLSNTPGFRDTLTAGLQTVNRSLRGDRRQPNAARYDPHAVQQQSGGRTPLGILADSDINRQLPADVAPRYSQSSRLAHRNDRSEVGGQPSPFFSRQGPVFETSRSRQATTPLNFQHRPEQSPIYEHNSISGSFGRDNTSTRDYNQRRPMERQIYRDTAVSDLNYQSSYRAPFVRPDSIMHHRQNAPGSQTLLNSQGLLYRPDGRPTQVTPQQTISKPQIKPDRTRVTLPPGYGPVSQTTSSEDRALSGLPGVRGLSTARGILASRNGASTHGAPRALFSSAGGRRSVFR